jgi:protein-tyrosine phosphatase
MIDTHCHILPGIDDGPRSMSESVELAGCLVAQGIDTVIATPHQLGTFGNADASPIRHLVRQVNDELGIAGVKLTVLPGAEVRIDVNLSALVQQERILTLADGHRYLLIELPADTLIDMTFPARELMEHGIVPVIAHAERLAYLAGHPDVVGWWIELGVVLQISARGLLGEWGPAAKRNAWNMVLSGQAALLATDAHDTARRRPMLVQAYEAVAARLGNRVADRLCTENPRRVIEGRELAAMFPKAAKAGLKE